MCLFFTKNNNCCKNKNFNNLEYCHLHYIVTENIFLQSLEKCLKKNLSTEYNDTITLIMKNYIGLNFTDFKKKCNSITLEETNKNNPEFNKNQETKKEKKKEEKEKKKKEKEKKREEAKKNKEDDKKQREEDKKRKEDKRKRDDDKKKWNEYSNTNKEWHENSNNNKWDDYFFNDNKKWWNNFGFGDEYFNGKNKSPPPMKKNYFTKKNKIETEYDILGISYKDDFKTIKKAYVKLILKWHPDKNPTNIKECEEMAKKINGAYKKIQDRL